MYVTKGRKAEKRRGDDVSTMKMGVEKKARI